MNENTIITPSATLDALNELTEQTDTNSGVLLVKLHGLERIGRVMGTRTTEEIISHLLPQFNNALHDDDMVFRIGRFEFLILLNDIINQGHAILAANKITGILQQPILIKSLQRKHPFSIGIALTPKNSDDPEELFRFAELAATAAQRTNTPFQVYSPDELKDVVTDWDIEGELEKSINNNELALYYQPKIDAKSGKIAGAEALMRWNHPEHGTILPGRFIPIAEQIGLMPKITWWCLNTALREFQLWKDCEEGISVAINISASDLTDKGFAKAVTDAIGIWDIESRQLTIEITESSLMRDIGLSARILSNIQGKGVNISIDDFGTGYSSLAYFKQLPVDEIKIDRSFITNILDSDFDLHIVNTINEMARALDLNVVAEGVESEDAKRILNKLGCNTLQGLYYSKPLPLESYLEWINSYQSS